MVLTSDYLFMSDLPKEVWVNDMGDFLNVTRSAVNPETICTSVSEARYVRVDGADVSCSEIPNNYESSMIERHKKHLEHMRAQDNYRDYVTRQNERLVVLLERVVCAAESSGPNPLDAIHGNICLVNEIKAAIHNARSSEVETLAAQPALPYGICPTCGAPGMKRERRPDGDTICENGHRHPSRMFDEKRVDKTV